MIHFVQSFTKCVRTGFLGFFTATLAITLSMGMAGVSRAVAGDEQMSEAQAIAKAESILDQNAKKVGLDAYKKLKSRVLKGKVEFAGGQIVADVNIYQSRPSNFYLVTEAPEFGKFERGCDSKVSWRLGTRSGGEVLKGQEAWASMRDATFDGVLHWRDYFKKAEYMGTEELDGCMCHKLKMTPKQGLPGRHFYDVETGMLVKSISSVSTDDGTTPVRAMYSDYRDVDGVMIAHTWESVYGFQRSTIKIESIEHNADIPAEKFALPDEIKDILAGKDSAAGDETKADAEEAAKKDEATKADS